MWKSFFVLAVETAAAAYLFYYVSATGGGYLAWMSVAVVGVHVFSSWTLLYIRLSQKSARHGPRAKGER